jgi:hypothetical protein
MIVGNLELEDRVETIMDYFGEFIDKDRAKELAVVGDNFWDRMNKIREILRGEGHDVPFRARYVRRRRDK